MNGGSAVKTSGQSLFATLGKTRENLSEQHLHTSAILHKHYSTPHAG
jgi:hypothetical protein